LYRQYFAVLSKHCTKLEAIRLFGAGATLTASD
jgi:hypothetical protein